MELNQIKLHIVCGIWVVLCVGLVSRWVLAGLDYAVATPGCMLGGRVLNTQVTTTYIGVRRPCNEDRCQLVACATHVYNR